MENFSRSEKMLKEQERQKKAKESYEKWLEKNKGKMLGQRRSYGFVNGKLTGTSLNHLIQNLKP